MQWHWQNLNDRNKYKEGSPVRHGRAWFYIRRLSIRIEWGIKWGLGCNVHTETDTRPGVGFHLHLLLPFVYVTFMHDGLGRYVKSDRKTGFSFDHYGTHLHLYLHSEYFGESGYSTMLDFRDIIFGRLTLTKKELDRFEVTIPLPEGNYKGTAHILQYTYRRSRLPFTTKSISTWVQLEEGLPHPGKGENSWDCEEDAILAFGTSSTKYEDIVADGVRNCMKNRRRYGSVNYIPEKV